jgi:phage portal protein BeeE
MILENADDIKAFKTKAKQKEPEKKTQTNVVSTQEGVNPNKDNNATTMSYGERGYIKRYIPYFIYKPPFGYPRRDIDVINVRKLAKTPFVFSVIKTLLDEITSLKWDVVAAEGIDQDKIKNKIKEIKDFLYNPNDNNESFRDLLRAITRDIFELDAGVIEKVYNRKGKLTQLFSVDSSTILMNPDEHGYIGARKDYIAPITQNIPIHQLDTYYTNVLSESAAYFQYNWTGGIFPVPFGKKELVYIKSNTQTDSMYGTSPIMVLYNVILTLMYATQVNLDMYVNNDLPNGILSVLGADKSQINATRDYFNQKILQKDEFGNDRKKFFNIPITSAEAKYTNFSFNAKDMQMLEQQRWYQKLVYSVFGVTPDEMGETQNSNRSTANEQSRIFKRKALKPILTLIEYYLNTQIVWELDPDKEVKFKFDDYDIEQEFRKAELNEKLMNTWTINEIRQKDNMEALEDEKYNEIGSSSQTNSFMGGFSVPNNTNDNEYTQNNKEDMQNNERSPEKEEVSNKSMSDVPKKTDTEKKLDSMYSKLEKMILEDLD